VAKRVTRTDRRILSIGAAWSAALALAVAAPGAAVSSTSTAGGQFVGGVVEEQFGAAVAPDGTITGSSSTIGVTVTRTVEHGIPVTTITPTG
jgi:hypothetical protein